MIRHVLGLAAVTALVVLITLLPFLPGSYDPLAAPLSMMARVFGWAGLLLVPAGALWLARPRHASTVIALIASSIVWAVVSLAALMFGGFSLGIPMLSLGAYVFSRARPRLKTAGRTAAVYFIVVPIAVVLLQQALLGPAIEFSRARAIQSAEPLIADIERYRAAHGAYPQSTLALWPDYKPSVIGIEKFHYEPSGDAYNLVFEQVARELSARELVVYNPRDEQEATSHAAARLRSPPERLRGSGGYFAMHTTPHPHWKYFWFD
jgi:hypothetical protein